MVKYTCHADQVGRLLRTDMARENRIRRKRGEYGVGLVSSLGKKLSTLLTLPAPVSKRLIKTKIGQWDGLRYLAEPAADARPASNGLTRK